ncbi:MAG: cellulase family glycosylhydrolase [Olegusella sp.]|nr:cellulase family glycosylhydrolase [Olegusella sp.]
MQLSRRSFGTLSLVALGDAALLAGCAKAPAARGGSGSAGGSAGGSPAGSADATGSDGSAAASPVANTYSAHGRLRVDGTHVVDEAGMPFQLRGVSTHGIAWFPQFVNRDAFASWQAWGANAVRLACYTDESGGWLTDGDHDELLATIDTGVQAANDLDMYAIVDWHVLHDQNPLPNLAAAQDFFATVCDRYGDHGNVIYEICNEPNGNVTWEDVRSYADQVTPTIRDAAPDALVICGTTTWSQDVDQVAAAPVDDANTVYALHFYAGTHKQDLRDKAQRAIDAGTPLFVSEFGITDASGNGLCDTASADEWIDFLDANQIGFLCWSLSNKNESSALILPPCDKTGGWDAADLSEEGVWLKGVLEAHAGLAPADDSGSSESDESTSDESGSSSGSSSSGQLKATAGDITVACAKSNSWSDGSSQFAQWDITVGNGGSAATSGWTITLTFASDVAVDQSWNGTYSASGSTVTVTPTDDWAVHIGAGQTITIGGIFKGANPTVTSVSVAEG